MLLFQQQNVSEFKHQGAGRDICTILQSQHSIPDHQGSPEEIQDTGGGGTREGGNHDNQSLSMVYHDSDM